MDLRLTDDDVRIFLSVASHTSSVLRRSKNVALATFSFSSIPAVSNARAGALEEKRIAPALPHQRVYW